MKYLDKCFVSPKNLTAREQIRSTRGVRAFLLSCFLLVPVHSYARIGEYEAQIVYRYNQASSREARKDGSVAVTYPAGRLRVVVIYQNGRSVCEMFSKYSGDDLNEAEIEAVLNADQTQSKWAEKRGGSFVGRVWTLESSGLIAVHLRPDEETYALTVCTRAFYDTLKARKPVASRTIPTPSPAPTIPEEMRRF